MQGLSGNPISNLLNRVGSQLVLDNPSDTMAPVPDLRDAIEQAKLEWMCARDYFDEVTDPGLIDYAIYQVKAAERRYMHLLNMARGGTPQVAAVAHPESSIDTPTLSPAQLDLRQDPHSGAR